MLPKNLAPPENCPYCQTKLVLDGAFPFCSNYHCHRRVYGRLQKFVDVHDVKGAGETLLMVLAEKGILKTPADLFSLTLEQFCQVERKGEKGYAKFKQGLEASREMSVAYFFASLDLEGRGTWEAICRVPGLQTIEQILEEAQKQNITLFSQAERVSPEKARNIMNEIHEKWDDILALKAHTKLKVAGTKLNGKEFCITGSLSQPRKVFEDKIKAAGGAVKGDVTGKTTYLVTNEPDPSSSKGRKAAAKGIPTINEATLLEMLS